MIKIRADKFFENEDFQNLNTYDFNTFQAMDEVEEFFDEFTYKIEDKKMKGGRRPKTQYDTASNQANPDTTKNSQFKGEGQIGGRKNRKKGKKGGVI